MSRALSGLRRGRSGSRTLFESGRVGSEGSQRLRHPAHKGGKGDGQCCCCCRCSKLSSSPRLAKSGRTTLPSLRSATPPPPPAFANPPTAADDEGMRPVSQPETPSPLSGRPSVLGPAEEGGGAATSVRPPRPPPPLSASSARRRSSAAEPKPEGEWGEGDAASFAATSGGRRSESEPCFVETESERRCECRFLAAAPPPPPGDWGAKAGELEPDRGGKKAGEPPANATPRGDGPPPLLAWW